MNDKTQETHLDLAEQYIVEMSRNVREQLDQIEILLAQDQSTKQASSFLAFSLEILDDTKQCRSKYLNNLKKG